MRFDLKKPCAECPFTRTAGGYLSKERAKEIARYILYGNVTFTCHKHLTGDYVEGEEDSYKEDEDQNADQDEVCNSYRPDSNDQHCAGALAFYDKLSAQKQPRHGSAKEYVSNQMIQIAERLGLRNTQRLHPSSQSMVYDSIEEMAAAHSNNVRRSQ